MTRLLGVNPVLRTGIGSSSQTIDIQLTVIIGSLFGKSVGSRATRREADIAALHHSRPRRPCQTLAASSLVGCPAICCRCGDEFTHWRRLFEAAPAFLRRARLRTLSIMMEARAQGNLAGHRLSIGCRILWCRTRRPSIADVRRCPARTLLGNLAGHRLASRRVSIGSASRNASCARAV
jgi:hypothetical protein